MKLLSMLIYIYLLQITICNAQYSPKAQVENCINLSAGKLVVPSDASMVVTPGCFNPDACYLLPADFSCITFGIVNKENIIKVDCTNEVVIPPEATPTDAPENGTPTTPTLPQCTPALCPIGYVYSQNPKDSFAVCTQTYQVLEVIPSKKAAYDAQKADAELVQTQWKEAQMNAAMQDYCIYYFAGPCQTLPAETKETIINKASYILGIPVSEVTRILNHKANKK